MSVASLTAIVIAASALLTVLLSVYWDRVKRHQAAAAARQRDDERLAENSDVSWVNINKAIVKERDLLQEKLNRQSAEHTAEIALMRAEHQREVTGLHQRWEADAAEMRRNLDAEAAELKKRYDEEMSALSTRLAECQNKVNALYRELYELQRLLPPESRPTPR